MTGRTPPLAPFMALVAALFAAPAAAVPVDQNTWVADGPVYAITRAGDTIYLGGDFAQIGPPTGAAVPVNTTSALATSWPGVAGTVYCIAPDGTGGWFLGGDFTAVGGQARSNLAHLDSGYELTAWDPGADDAVYALAVDAGKVYVGGAFTHAGFGTARTHVAALDASTGVATSWNPSADAGGVVRVLAVAGATVYAGGEFTSIGGQSRPRIAALSAATGLATSWNPGADGAVRTMTLTGSLAYLGGDFTTAGGQPRARIAAIDLASGAATSFDPGANATVYTIIEHNGVILAGGAFTFAAGGARSRLAEIDPSTGEGSEWSPSANGTVRALVVEGLNLYVGGDFTILGGEVRNRVGALSFVGGVATAWDPNAAGQSVHALASDPNTFTMFVCGDFPSVNGVGRGRIAAIDATTGQATSWSPGASGPVRAIAVDEAAGLVYAGGDFSVIGDAVRNRIAALDATTGLATTWDPNADASVRTLARVDDVLYAGGSFTSIGGQTRHRVAALDATTGAATAWDPDADGVVEVLSATAARIYAGGAFTSIGGASRGGVAALSPATGAADPLFDPDANGAVLAIAVGQGTVYLGGDFTTVGPFARPHVAQVDAVNGVPTAWSPAADQTVHALALDHRTVYVGGEFTNITGIYRNHVAAVDAVGGAAREWDPFAGRPGQSVFAMAVGPEAVHLGGDFDAVSFTAHRAFATVPHALAIFHVSKDRGGDTGLVTMTIVGEGFLVNPSVRLEREAEDVIDAQYATTTPDGQSVIATFDLTGALHGPWDVVVVNHDDQSVSRIGGFTVEATTPYGVRVEIVGPAKARPDRARGFDLVLENVSNADAVNLPLWITGVPEDGAIDFAFDVDAPPVEGGEPDWTAAPPTRTAAGTRYAAIVIPRLAPGTTVRSVYVTVPATVTEYTLTASLAPPWSGSEALVSSLGGAITDPACVAAGLATIESAIAVPSAVGALNAVAVWGKVLRPCEGTATLEEAVDDATAVLEILRGPLDGGPVPPDGEVALVPRWQDRHHVAVVTSLDPNEKLGPAGVGPDQRIGEDQLLPYSIRFENLELASAPAQEIVIVDVLAPATLDKNTVSLGPIRFGTTTIYPPPGLRTYFTTVALESDPPLRVAVGGNLDVASGVVTWSLTAIDPATGAAPEDPGIGFLPPNVSPPEGEGSVLLTVMPVPGLTGGTEVRNDATIVFDGAPLVTPEWVNVVDGATPESAVLPLPASTDSTTFTVRWAPIGTAFDLHDYSVYVSDNGAPYRPWRAQVTATADTFRAVAGHNYAFYSLARDSSGNVEPVPGSPDAQTTTLVGVGEGPAPAFALEGALPNPSSGGARVWLALPARARAELEIVDVAGRRVLRRDVGALGAGRHAVDVSAATRRPGLYFIRLRQGDRTLRARMTVIR